MERLQSHRDFVAVLKRRRKVGGKDIIVHYLMRNDHQPDDQTTYRRLGLAVSKSVGNAVTRNTVKRRFRVLAKAHEESLRLLRYRGARKTKCGIRIVLIVG